MKMKEKVVVYLSKGVFEGLRAGDVQGCLDALWIALDEAAENNSNYELEEGED